MTLKSIALAIGCASLAASGASATTVSTVGGEIIGAPAQVTNALVFNTIIQAFDERQRVTLADDLAVDSGTIAAGTTVSSHMIFLNKQNGVPGSLSFGIGEDAAVTFTFDGAILGVMSDSNGTLEVASTPFLGAIDTDYGQPFNNRGMESNPLDGSRNNDWYSVSGNTISLGMFVTQPGDWIRVVTAPSPVPAPAAGVLLPVALGLMAALRRRRRAA